MSEHETDPALPYLSYCGSPICLECGRPFQRGERVELICGGKRTLPIISIDGESQYSEGGFTKEESEMVTFDFVHRECA